MMPVFGGLLSKLQQVGSTKNITDSITLGTYVFFLSCYFKEHEHFVALTVSKPSCQFLKGTDRPD